MAKIPDRCTRADDEFHVCNCDCVGYERDLAAARGIVEQMAGEDCESYCGLVSRDSEEEHECWPTKARVLTKKGGGG